jgi:hypothetical protein
MQRGANGVGSARLAGRIFDPGTSHQQFILGLQLDQYGVRAEALNPIVLGSTSTQRTLSSISDAARAVRDFLGRARCMRTAQFKRMMAAGYASDAADGI